MKKITMTTLLFALLCSTNLLGQDQIEEQNIKGQFLNAPEMTRTESFYERIQNSTPNQIFIDDFTQGLAHWMSIGQWDIQHSKSGLIQGEPNAFVKTGVNNENYTDNSNDWLISPLIELPQNADMTLLLFKEKFNIESYHDLGIVKVSIDSGTSWIPLNYSTGHSDWRESIVDLTSYQGNTIMIGFNFTSDETISERGWEIGEVMVQSYLLTTFDIHLQSINSQNFPIIYLNTILETDDSFVLDESNFTVFENDVSQTELFQVIPPESGGGQRLADIIIVLDVTASMGPYITAVKNNLLSFINALAGSGINYNVGFITFGDIYYVYNNYNFYTDLDQINSVANGITLGEHGIGGGGDFPENPLGAMAAGAQFNFRPGAERIHIMITDANAHEANHVTPWTVQSLINDMLVPNNIMVFPIFQTSQSNQISQYVPIANATNPNGTYFNINDNFNTILNEIGDVLGNTYIIRYRSSQPNCDGVLRNVEVVANYDTNEASDEGSYMPCSTPLIYRTDETLALHNQAWDENTPFEISVHVIDDIVPYVNLVRIFHKNTTDETFQNISMSNVEGNIWTVNIPPGAVTSPGFDYYFTATDGVNNVSDPKTNPSNNPFQIAILPNVAPVINHVPVQLLTIGQAIDIVAEVIDNTNHLADQTLFYRKVGQILYQAVEMLNTGGNNFSAQIPISYAVAEGVEYYISAWDDFNVRTDHGTPSNPHLISSSGGGGNEEIFIQPPFDGGTAYASVIDDDFPIDYESADNFYGLEDEIEEFVFYGVAMKWIDGGWQEQIPAASEPFFIRFYTYEEEVAEGLIAPSTGTYQLALRDEWDHWDWGAGSFVSLYINGSIVIENATMVFGDPDPKYYPFAANAGDEISTIYTPGNWADENYYAIIDPQANIIAEEGGTWNNPGQSVPGNIEPGGELIVSEPEWTNPLSEQYITTTVTNEGTIWGGERQLYKFVAPLSTPINMEEGWISAQIDANNGSGTWFLWLNSAIGDGQSWQRLVAARNNESPHLVEMASISIDGSSNQLRDQILSDLAFELWGGFQAVAPSVSTSVITNITQTTATGGGNVTSDGGATVTARGICYSTSPNPTTANPTVPSGSGTGSFTANMTGLTPGTTYYVRAYATNSEGTAYGDQVQFTTSTPAVVPTVTTASIIDITQTTASGGGNVTIDGGAAVTTRGICYSTSPNPTTANSTVPSGSGTGSFTANMTGLTPGTTYYVRAYATNSAGTAYGGQVQFTTSTPIVVPTVTTASITNITQTTATGGGNVTSDGGATVTVRGICYSTSPNPTTANSTVPSGSGTGSFTANMTGLTPGTTYYVRAYATNSAGTAYGGQVQFTTNTQVFVPTITVNPSNLDFGNVNVGSASAAQSYTLGWSDLTSNITVTSNLNHYKVSLSQSGPFTSSITVPTSMGNSSVITETNNADDDYIVIRGVRPQINLDNVPTEAYEPGIIQIKLSPGMEKLIPAIKLSVNQFGFVETGNSVLDALNRKFNVTSYEPLFTSLYETGSKSSDHKKRHEAWGFHLWFKLKIDERADINNAVKEFALLDEIEIAEPEYRKQSHAFELVTARFSDENRTAPTNWTPNDPMYSTQWHYHNTGQHGGTADADIDLPEAWDIEKGHSDVIVAIIDDGIQTNHPDLAGNMWSGVGFNFVNNSSTIVPGNHGTHVAGTVGAVSNNGVGVAGVAGGSGSGDGVRLMSCQVFQGNNDGGFHLAPVYAADNGAAISQNSWGYTYPDVYEQNELDAIDYFNLNGGGSVSTGGITIFAAGNDNASGQYFPGCYAGALSVAATNNQDQRAWYSNFDTWVDISAPGGETNQVAERGVHSTITGSNYGWIQGTSMACPHVSGVAALLLSYATRNSISITNTQIWNLLVNHTDDHYAQNPGFIGQLGSGRLNAYNSLNALSGSGTNQVTIWVRFEPGIAGTINSTISNSATGATTQNVTVTGAGIDVNFPTVITANITNITQTTATGGGNVTSDGGSAVTTRGICYSTIPNPTTANFTVPSGSGTGSFTSNMSGLTPGTTYYVRAYATNSAGTAYGSQVSFVTAEEGCEPGWVPIPNLQYNMQVVAQIIIDDQPSLNPDDVLGAFVGDECRGMASPLPGVDGLVFLTVGSNTATGEQVELRIWNSNTCQSCDAGPGFTFVNQSELGTFLYPYLVACDTDVELDLNFGQGYTWFSVNVNPGNMGPNTLFADLSPCYDDRIIGQTTFALYTGETWVGGLTQLAHESMYRMKLCSLQILNLIGAPAPLDPINLSPGYTWLGYLPQQCQPINQALAGLVPAASYDDRLIGQNSFALYNGTQWVGTLTSLCPGIGYIIRLENSSVLTYTEAFAKHFDGSTYINKSIVSPTGFEPDNHMQHSMMLLAKVDLGNGQFSVNPADVIYAYIDEEVHGMAIPIPELGGAVFMNIGANSHENLEVSFKMWSDEHQSLFDINESLVFEPLKATGNWDEPFILTLKNMVGITELNLVDWTIGEPFPNPFTEQTIIPYSLSNSAQVKVQIYNSLGQIVQKFEEKAQQAGRHQLKIDRESIRSGVYHVAFTIITDYGIGIKHFKIIIQ